MVMKILRIWPKRLGALLRESGGGYALEFALLAPVFFLLLLGIMELGYMVFVQAVLDGSARDAARLIRTGQVQTAANPQGTFQTLLCNDMSAFVGCGNLYFNVKTYGSFSAASTGLNQPIQFDNNGNPINVTFVPGAASQIVTVQAIYNRPFFTTMVGQYLGVGDNAALLMSTVVFMNEPFTAGS
jgi:Flp pilus assembly protein TadG